MSRYIFFIIVSFIISIFQIYTYYIFVLLSSLSPFFLFLLISSLPIKLLINELIINRISRLEKKNNNNTYHINSSSFSINNNNSYPIRSRIKIIWLMLFMLLS